NSKNGLRYSQILTLIIGVLALLIALKMTSVLELMLHSYSFMVSGMIIPVLAALFTKKPNSIAALSSMIVGGGTTLSLIFSDINLPLGLDANIFGIGAALIAYLIVNFSRKS
ncbi:MAG: sodium:solute symporter family protein, partial [Mariniphaga sp.]|nr:sodium:solute symporter family protein [Mariniphaga sp.]